MMTSPTDTVDIGDTRALTAAIAHAFLERGEEVFLVGGAVRDEFLGVHRPLGELDFATSAPPDVTLSILDGLHLGVPYRVGERFGTIGLRVDSRHVEVTTYRSEVYSLASRKPEVTFGTSLLGDLQRRDFTVNALAQHPLTGEILDPLGGREDLRQRVLRAVGEPDVRFSEDPLRILRAARFASTLDLFIESHTWAGMVRCAPRLETISRERIRDELSRILLGARPERGLTIIRDSGAMSHTVPELLTLSSMPDHGPFHPLSLWDHTMQTVEGTPPRLRLRLAALLHDIGKPKTRTHEPSGRPRFFHHEEVGAAIARQILAGLRYPHSVIDDVVRLIETHMQLHAYSDGWTNGAVRRLMLRLGPLLPEALTLARADAAAHVLSGAPASAPALGALEARIEHLDGEHTQKLQSPLSGHDLMSRYKRTSGPWIGRIKDVLRDEVLEGRLQPNDRTAAWQIADAMVEGANDL